MRGSKRLLMVLLALIILVSGAGVTAKPAQASGCIAYHTVRYGESLSWIARYYGVYWPYLAQVNGVRPPRYTIYPGQVLCIPSGSGPYYPPGPSPINTGGRTWSFSVTGMVANANVTIQTHNFPNNVIFKVRMGRYSGGGYDWVNLPDLDTGNGGSFSATFTIPAQFSGANQLVLRLIQHKKNGKTFSMDQVFYNRPSGGTGGIPGPGYYPPYYYWGIPTIWIVSVVRDTSVTIQTHNFPPGLTFDVLMGPMGTRGVGGYHVGTINSGAGGTLVATFSIPPQLYGSYQIAIRTQNWATGYYSYNWFYNSTTY